LSEKDRQRLPHFCCSKVPSGWAMKLRCGPAHAWLT
jgi:hypothetical protein